MNDIIRYLKSELLARNFLAMSEETQDLIAGRLAEIYVNAFDHAGSPVGVLTCGHYKKATKQVQLAALDLGIGIPGSVRRFFKQQRRRPPIGDEAMRWAFQRGTTTKPGLVTRGNGLHLLVELISRYHGFMEVRSNEGRVVIEREGTTFGRTPVGISGTLIRLTLSCDTAPFDIGDAQDEPLF